MTQSDCRHGKLVATRLVQLKRGQPVRDQSPQVRFARGSITGHVVESSCGSLCYRPCIGLSVPKVKVVATRGRRTPHSPSGIRTTNLGGKRRTSRSNGDNCPEVARTQLVRLLHPSPCGVKGLEGLGGTSYRAQDAACTSYRARVLRKRSALPCVTPAGLHCLPSESAHSAGRDRRRDTRTFAPNAPTTRCENALLVQPQVHRSSRARISSMAIATRSQPEMGVTTLFPGVRDAERPYPPDLHSNIGDAGGN
jgi:hypothetical protein